ncbi:MAG: hypothetical protein ABJB47_15485, partial [Actinomycetota bacterium]
AIERAAAATRPVLIYLRPTDIAAALTRTYAERGEAWAAQNMAWVAACPWARSRGLSGPQAVVQLYQAWQAWEKAVDDMFGGYSFAKLMVTGPQQDRAAALNQICAVIRP